MQRRKGITLIELVVGIAIAAMLAVVTVNILPVGLNASRLAEDEFERQADIRTAMLNVNSFIRYSTAAFAVTKEKFQPVEDLNTENITNLSDGWNYFGVSPDGKELVHYKYDSASGKHVKEVVVADNKDITYSIKFYKNSESIDDKLLQFKVECYKAGELLFEYESEIEALNALQVISQGDAANVSVALAYRADARPVVEQVYAAVSMILDMSGSMNARMDGSGRNDSNPPSDARIRILKTRAIELIDSLENSYISIVPFSTTANIPHQSMPNISNPSGFRFVDDTRQKEQLEYIANGLNALGGTNTGDGMRRGYYQLKSFNENKPSTVSSAEIKNYMVILVDGVTNIGNMEMQSFEDYQGDSGYIKSEELFGWVKFNNHWIWGVIGYKYWYDKSTDQNTLANGNLLYMDSIVNGPFYANDGSDIRKSKFENGRGIKGNPWSNSETASGKDYVDLVGANLIQGKNGYADLNIETFVIGFSSLTSDLESVANIAKAAGIPVTDADIESDFKDHKYIYIATDTEGLKDAFSRIGGIIKTELWQVWGP